MFSKVLIEKDCLDHPRTTILLDNLRIKKDDPAIVVIDHLDQWFNRYKKPYLHKRDSLNLYIAKKRESSVKLAPPAYGTSGEKHYYFIHAYNCIYECNYCYLQSHFNSPDLVFFINHEDILQKMQEIIDQETQTVWFHAGEYSDSLALSHLTQELPLYFDFFSQNPRAKLELRTKSANTKALESLLPLQNVFISFSLAPEKMAKASDLKTPGIKTRLKAMQKIHQMGHRLAIHFDPIIYDHNIVEDYQELLGQMREYVPLEDLHYLSLGVVRFSKDNYHQAQKNYPDAPFLKTPLKMSSDNKIKYPLPMRQWLLQKIADLAVNQGFFREKIYFCMEEEEIPIQ